MKKSLAAALLIILIALAFFKFRPAPPAPPAPEPVPVAVAQQTAPAPVEDPALQQTKQDILSQLEVQETKPRTLKIPKAPRVARAPAAEPLPPPTPRASGRKKREGLPMGVVILDDTIVQQTPKEKAVAFRMMTGDMVRVFPDDNHDFYHVQPGLDVFLAATTKEVRPAGEHLPDQDGWVRKSNLHIFEPEAAKEFIMEVSPVTLGNDPSFSTIGFYERAMKNPDPVVHRVVGPRLIALVQLHEDYSTSWSKLYRDNDPKIRDAALSALNVRGVNGNREIIEDLIVRLTELTKVRAQGETELEVLSILNVLQNSHHPRVPAALASFKEAWKETQGEKINKELAEILNGQ